MNAVSPEPAPTRNPRLKLALMFLAPLLAVVAASFVYYTGIGLPGRTTNKGVLVVPPRQIAELALRSADGAPWRDTEQGRWSMLIAGTGNCGSACADRLYLTRQLRKALGDDALRVRRIYLSTADSLDPATERLLATEHGDLLVLHADEAALRGLLARPGDPDPLDSGAFYLVDPRGFVMMYYLPVHAGRDTLSDLRFLLKNSR